MGNTNLQEIHAEGRRLLNSWSENSTRNARILNADFLECPHVGMADINTEKK